jgi:tight adherence protein C
MIILLIIGLVLTTAAVFLGLRALNFARVRSAATVENIDLYGFTGRTESVVLESGALESVDWISRLGDFVSTRFSGFDGDNVRKELAGAGLYNITPRKFTGYRAISLVGIPALLIWVLATMSLPIPILIIGGAAAIYAGWKVPLWLVQSRGRRRKVDIDLQLPELIDLLVVTVEAGVGFNEPLRIAGQRVGGPLGQELRLTMQENEMGLALNEALANLLARAETPGLRSFIRSVLQGETLGVSIGQILRNIATEMRKRRRALAEERAQKAPIKILFPLVFMIFPAIFVIILGPAIYSITDTLHK